MTGSRRSQVDHRGEGTRIDLIHSGWEHLGKQAAGMRAGYDTGWDFVLGLYVD